MVDNLLLGRLATRAICLPVMYMTKPATDDSLKVMGKDGSKPRGGGRRESTLEFVLCLIAHLPTGHYN